MWKIHVQSLLCLKGFEPPSLTSEESVRAAAPEAALLCRLLSPRSLLGRCFASAGRPVSPGHSPAPSAQRYSSTSALRLSEGRDAGCQAEEFQ